MKRWRVVYTGTNDAFFNMALDEVLLLSCQKGTSPPALRLYLWNPPAVSIGYFQSTEKTVDFKACKSKGIQVVRRITGGRAVLHEDEITYSVCASSDHFAQLGENTIQTYKRLSMALLEALLVLGINGEWVKPSRKKESSSFHATPPKPCFASNSRYEITVYGKKLIGSAQRRFSFRSGGSKKDSFIQHGSILTGNGKHSLAELLPDESSTKTVRFNLEEKSTNIERILKRRVKPEEMVSALKIGFGKVFTCQMEDFVISQKELDLAKSLRKEKYLKDRWNLQR